MSRPGLAGSVNADGAQAKKERVAQWQRIMDGDDSLQGFHFTEDDGAPSLNWEETSAITGLPAGGTGSLRGSMRGFPRPEGDTAKKGPSNYQCAATLAAVGLATTFLTLGALSYLERDKPAGPGLMTAFLTLTGFAAKIAVDAALHAGTYFAAAYGSFQDQWQRDVEAVLAPSSATLPPVSSPADGTDDDTGSSAAYDTGIDSDAQLPFLSRQHSQQPQSQSDASLFQHKNRGAFLRDLTIGANALSTLGFIAYAALSPQSPVVAPVVDLFQFIGSATEQRVMGTIAAGFAGGTLTNASALVLLMLGRALYSAGKSMLSEPPQLGNSFR